MATCLVSQLMKVIPVVESIDDPNCTPSSADVFAYAFFYITTGMPKISHKVCILVVAGQNQEEKMEEHLEDW